MSENKVIETCFIEPSTGMFSSPKVMVKYKGESEYELLFEYYPDEISFSAGEFIGLTAEQGRKLKFTKDKAYLQA